MASTMAVLYTGPATSQTVSATAAAVQPAYVVIGLWLTSAMHAGVTRSLTHTLLLLAHPVDAAEMEGVACATTITRCPRVHQCRLVDTHIRRSEGNTVSSTEAVITVVTTAATCTQQYKQLCSSSCGNTTKQYNRTTNFRNPFSLA